MAERAEANPKIEFVWNYTLDEVTGTDKDGVTGVALGSTTGAAAKRLDATGVFLAIGHTPNTTFLEGQVQLTDKKYIVLTTPFRTNTSVRGVFAAGDVADDYYRQAITSAGTGCMAALDAERWLAARLSNVLTCRDSRGTRGPRPVCPRSNTVVIVGPPAARFRVLIMRAH